MPAHHLENFLLILRLPPSPVSPSLEVSSPLCAEFFSPCNKQKEIRYSNRGRLSVSRAPGGRAAVAQTPRSVADVRIEWGGWPARSKSQKFPFVRESGAKRCRFFGRGAYGSVAAAVWTYGVMMRATAAWQKMQHLVRAERAAARLIG